MNTCTLQMKATGYSEKLADLYHTSSQKTAFFNRRCDTIPTHIRRRWYS